MTSIESLHEPVKVAFITYEYPPDTAFGGIATYVHQAARMLHSRGHHVEVFAGSQDRSKTTRADGFLVHRVQELDLRNFYLPIGKVFAERHAAVQFDVLEGPEYAADAREAVRLVPEIPLVIKLHTPTRLLFELNCNPPPALSLKAKVSGYLGSLVRGARPGWGRDLGFERYRAQTKAADDVERSHALDADEIASPSKELGEIVADIWGLNPDMVAHVPYPYRAPEKLLRIPVETHTNVVTFMGRLEVRKGVLQLAEAIPKVLDRFPEARFRFVGSSDDSPDPGVSMVEFLSRKLRNYRRAVKFTGGVPMETIPEILATTDVCVFPSLWENFPLVCLESMAAARGIVASNAGGMKDMLNDGEAGLLIPPGSADAITEALIDLLNHPEARMQLGELARRRLLNEYNVDCIGALQEASYIRAKARRLARGSRASTC